MGLLRKFRIQTYNVGFVTKGIDAVMTDGIGQGDIIWLKHDYKDRFFADPFLWDYDDEYLYVLVEEVLFWEYKGRIVLLKVRRSDYALISRRVVIDEPTHLSFPLCRCGGDTIIPESSASGRWTAYKINRDTMEIESKQVLLEIGTIDAVFYENEKGSWILTGKLPKPNDELYIYRKDEAGSYVISEEPVLTDVTQVRSAGPLFTWKGKLFRPVQDSGERYGRRTRIMQVDQISGEKYSVSEWITLTGDENPPYNETLHTFNIYDPCILVDGSKDFLRFPMKLLYRYCGFLFHGD